MQRAFQAWANEPDRSAAQIDQTYDEFVQAVRDSGFKEELFPKPTSPTIKIMETVPAKEPVDPHVTTPKRAVSVVASPVKQKESGREEERAKPPSAPATARALGHFDDRTLKKILNEGMGLDYKQAMLLRNLLKGKSDDKMRFVRTLQLQARHIVEQLFEDKLLELQDAGAQRRITEILSADVKINSAFLDKLTRLILMLEMTFDRYLPALPSPQQREGNIVFEPREKQRDYYLRIEDTLAATLLNLFEKAYRETNPSLIKYWIDFCEKADFSLSQVFVSFLRSGQSFANYKESIADIIFKLSDPLHPALAAYAAPPTELPQWKREYAASGMQDWNAFVLKRSGVIEHVAPLLDLIFSNKEFSDNLYQYVAIGEGLSFLTSGDNATPVSPVPLQRHQQSCQQRQRVRQLGHWRKPGRESFLSDRFIAPYLLH